MMINASEDGSVSFSSCITEFNYNLPRFRKNFRLLKENIKKTRWHKLKNNFFLKKEKNQ